MELNWYYHRLRSMSPGEMCWRFRRLLWQVYAKRAHGRWHARYTSHRSSYDHAVSALAGVKFYGLEELSPADVPSAWVRSATDVADNLLRHRFRYFALGEISLGETIRWNHEYKRDIDTPLVFGPWMDYRDNEAYGDFKYFWEVPRLQHLILLAKAYYLTGRADYAEEVLHQLRQFQKESPYLLGVNWTVSMEAGIRLISLCWITMFLRQYLGEHREGLDLIEGVVRANLDYVVHNYARYSSANNHLIGEAAGVFVTSICFGHLRGMRRHRDKAQEILSREIHLQHYSDGVNKEQATHYQVFAMQFFLLAGLLGRANGRDFSTEYWQMLEKGVEFIGAMFDDRCQLPQIGDSDDGRAVVLSAETADDTVTVLATAAAVFDRYDVKRKVEHFDEGSFWLLGARGREAFENLEADGRTDELPSRFDHGGYYLLDVKNGAGLRVVFDCGPLGFGAIAAHGHADALSFTLAVGNLPFLIDPGTYTYDRKNPLRNYFRSTAAHNTLTVDGYDQSEMAGPFLWGRKANAHIEQYVDDPGRMTVAGWHDGYMRLSEPVIHRRTIDIEKATGIVRLRDTLSGEGAHEVAIWFHLSPECEIDAVGENHFRLANGDRVVELLIDTAVTCEVICGRADPPAGWASFAYDEKVPTNTVVCRGTFCGEAEFYTHIYTHPGGGAEPARCYREHEPGQSVDSIP